MRIGIIGLGYVGLPLALAFGEGGHAVIGYDTDSRRVERLAAGESDVEDVPSARLARLGDAFEPTNDPAALARCDALLICVPTPLANQRAPDLSYISAAARTLAGVLREGQVVVLESTTYPGTTRDHLQPLLEESGLRAGADFHLAYSPERIDPGRSDHTIATTPKVIGGITDACTERASEIYELICDEVVPVSSPEPPFGSTATYTVRGGAWGWAVGGAEKKASKSRTSNASDSASITLPMTSRMSSVLRCP